MKRIILLFSLLISLTAIAQPPVRMPLHLLQTLEVDKSTTLNDTLYFPDGSWMLKAVEPVSLAAYWDSTKVKSYIPELHVSDSLRAYWDSTKVKTYVDENSQKLNGITDGSVLVKKGDSISYDGGIRYSGDTLTINTYNGMLIGRPDIPRTRFLHFKPNIANVSIGSPPWYISTTDGTIFNQYVQFKQGPDGYTKALLAVGVTRTTGIGGDNEDLSLIRMGVEGARLTDTAMLFFKPLYVNGEPAGAGASFLQRINQTITPVNAGDTIQMPVVKIDSLAHDGTKEVAVGVDADGTVSKRNTKDLSEINVSNWSVTNMTSVKSEYQYQFGTRDTVATSATLTLTLVLKNSFTVTGTDNIETISSSLPENTEITLHFTGDAAATGLVDNTGNLKLNGNFLYTTDDIVKLIKIGGNWHEISRSAN